MSELALAHLFAVSRFIGTANVEMRQGKWNKKGEFVTDDKVIKFPTQSEGEKENE